MLNEIKLNANRILMELGLNFVMDYFFLSSLKVIGLNVITENKINKTTVTLHITYFKDLNVLCSSP